MGVYPLEQFTDDEAAVLRPYFTNLDRPVFALVNLPEVVKGALFARYSRTHKSLRRLFLDEFVADLDLTGDLTVDATVGLQARRGALRARVPRVRRRLRRAARRRAPRVRAGVEPAHQDPRVGPADGVPRAVDALHPVRHEARRPLPLLPRLARCSPTASSRGATSPTWTRCSTRTREMLPTARSTGHASATRRSRATPTSSTSRRSRRRRATRSAASCPRRRCRTSASTAPARRSRRCCSACARTRCPRRAAYAAMMLEELRKVIPSFLARVDRDDRGVAWSAYLAETRARHRGARRPHLRRRASPSRGPSVTLTDFDPDAEDKLLAAICYPHTHLPDDQVLGRGPHAGRRRARRAARARTSGSATTAVTSPGARSSASTTASTSSPTTARSATCSVTACSRSSGSRCRTLHGYEVPGADRRSRARATVRRRDGALGRALRRARSIRSPSRRRTRCRSRTGIRFAMQMNAREAMHLLELRTAPSGHPSYRQIAQEMHRLIAEQAGHRAIAAAMSLRRPHHLRARAPRRGARRGGAARRRAQCDQQSDRQRENFFDALTRIDARRCRSRRSGCAIGSRLTRTPSVGRTTWRPHRSVVGRPAARGARRGRLGGSGDQVENAGITRLHGRPGQTVAPTVSWAPSSPSGQPASVAHRRE